MAGVLKIAELDGKQILKKEEVEGLRGKIYIINPDESEVAKNLGIKEKGIFGAKFR